MYVITIVATVFHPDLWGCGVSFLFFTDAPGVPTINRAATNSDVWYGPIDCPPDGQWCDVVGDLTASRKYLVGHPRFLKCMSAWNICPCFSCRVVVATPIYCCFWNEVWARQPNTHFSEQSLENNNFVLPSVKNLERKGCLCAPDRIGCMQRSSFSTFFLMKSYY